MNILIIGCGKLGARLANVLDSQDHNISVIANEKSLAENLDENFSGLSIPGNPIDLDTMKAAGVEGCDYAICVTENDNANIMAAQIIKNTFRIDNILVRILDPLKCRVYSQMNMSTISPTSLAYESIYSKIFHCFNNKIVDCGKSSIAMTFNPYEKWMRNKKFSEIEFVTKHKLLGFLDENDRLIMFNSKNDRKIEKTDRLVYTSIID